jgi:hypothetical protein
VPLAFSLVVLLLAGCGQKEDRPTVLPVKGVVSFKGAPVGGATVVFRPVGEGRGAAGMTDAEGRFVLRTFEPGDGAMPGDYVVLVQKGEVDSGWSRRVHDMKFKSTKDYEDWKRDNNVPRDLGVTGVRAVVPILYSDPQSSPLRATVAVGSSNGFAFDLSE